MAVGEPVEETGSTRDGDLDPDVGTESIDAVTPGAEADDEPDTEVTDLTPLTGGAADAAVRGVDEILGREVRLVMLPPVSGEGLSDRIEQVRHLARLHHPHLLEVYDVDGLAPDTESTLVLENVSGEPLPLVLREGPIDDADLARMGAQLASALSHAHAHGVHHGAIGPSSVLVDRRRSAAWLVGLTASLTGPLPLIDPESAETPDDEAARRAADVRALARTLADVAALPGTAQDDDAETLPVTREESVSPLLALLRDADTALPPSAAALSERLVRLGRDETADTDDAESSRLVPVVASWTDASAAPDSVTSVVAAGPAVHARGAHGITPLGVVAGPVRRARRAGVLGAATATLALASGLVIWAGESHVVRQAPQAEVGTALPVTAPASPVLPGLPAQPASDSGSGSSGSSGSADDETRVAPPSRVGRTSPSTTRPSTTVPSTTVPSTTASTPARVVPPVPTVQPTTKPVEPTTKPVEPPPTTVAPTPTTTTVAPTTTAAPTTTVAPTTTTVAPTTTTVAPTTTTTAPGAPAAVLAAGLPG